ncbi:protein of unknown function [Methanoculleus bourgensis]|uniref:Uncharacterized protein n=1 Tax=Methanoculleus bourgensis TaxID=83986 RepID=A0A0X3BKN7_9EURY|nr:protein of unknown function [Methanoculleus bourgensis]
MDLENDDAATALVKGCLATLDALFSNEAVTVDTANHNAARIWKLYGTLSRKGDNTPERPHRRARLLAVPDDIRMVPREYLQHLAGLLPREGTLQPKKKAAGIDLAPGSRSTALPSGRRGPTRAAPSTSSTSARSPRPTKTGHSRSSLRTVPSSPAATTQVAAGAPSGGRNSGRGTSRSGPGPRQRRPRRYRSLLPFSSRTSTRRVPSRSSRAATRSPSSSTPSTKPTSATGPLQSAWSCRSPHSRW